MIHGNTHTAIKMKFSITSTLISIFASVSLSVGGMVWSASGKSHDIEQHSRHIESLQKDVKELSTSDSKQEAVLSRLDERTVRILNILERK